MVASVVEIGSVPGRHSKVSSKSSPSIDNQGAADKLGFIMHRKQSRMQGNWLRPADLLGRRSTGNSVPKRTMTGSSQVHSATRQMQKLCINEGGSYDDNTDSGYKSCSVSSRQEENRFILNPGKSIEPSGYGSIDDESCVSCDGCESLSSAIDIFEPNLEPVIEEKTDWKSSDKVYTSRGASSIQYSNGVTHGTGTLLWTSERRKRKRAHGADLTDDAYEFRNDYHNGNSCVRSADEVIDSPDIFLETWEFTFNDERRSPSPPSLDPEEFSARLQKTMAYSQKASNGETFLQCVILVGMEVTALSLIEQMVTYMYLDVRNSFGQTALHLAVVQNLPRVARRLLAHGASPDVQDHRGNTPLHVAVAKGYYDCVETLTRHLIYEEVKDIPYPVPFRLIPQNLEKRNYAGEGVLHIAVRNSHVDIVRYLVHEMSVDVDIADGKRGMTPLHIAAELNLMDVARCLVQECRVNINIMTYDGRSALDLAMDYQHKDMVEYLWRAGCRHRQLNGFSDEDDSGDDYSD